MSESYTRSLVRHYWLVAIVSLLTWFLHSGVDRKFSKYMDGMRKTTRLKDAVRMEELEAYRDNQESMRLHLASRQHLQDAYAKEYEAMQFLSRLRDEEFESEVMHDAASRLQDEAKEDEAKAQDLDYASIADRLDYISSKIQGTAVAERAEKEAAEAEKLLTLSQDIENEAIDRLHRAEMRLNATNTTLEVVTENQGVCRWLSWACIGIEKSTTGNIPGRKISDEAVSIAAEFDAALDMLEKSKEERQHAVELLHKSSRDVNVSMGILEEAEFYQERSDEEHLEASKLLSKAKNEEESAEQDELIGEVEDGEIAADRISLINALNAMSRNAVAAREESQSANAFDYRSEKDRSRITETELEMREVTFQAKRHVAHAGWMAVLATLFATSLFTLSIMRIVETCQTREPWMWLIRNEKISIRDVSYIYIHGLILIIAMGFSSQLLSDYHLHGSLARAEIVVVFALVGSCFQVILLHLLPNIIRLVTVSSFNSKTFFMLLSENVGKSGVIVFFVFVLEILICWINFGTVIFSRVDKLNRPWLWVFATIAGCLHIIFFESYVGIMTGETTQNQDCQSDVSSITVSEQGTELRFLAEGGGSNQGTPGSWNTISLTPATSRNANLSNYGSTSGNIDLSLTPEIASTFISSWSSQLIRLKVLFDILLASWAVWVARHNMTIIFKLSPVAPQIVWGFLPLWFLDVVLATLFLFCMYKFYKWRQSQNSKGLEVLDEAGSLPQHTSNSTRPLLG